jgi:predicted DNA-binding transcriptional regulator AlpA
VTEEEFPLTSGQSSKYIGISDATLRSWRARGIGPRYYKAGEKLVRYRRSDLDAWIEEHLTPAAEPANAQ